MITVIAHSAPGYMSKSADKNFFQIVMIKIVSSHTLWNLSLELVYTDFVDILSARVRRA